MDEYEDEYEDEDEDEDVDEAVAVACWMQFVQMLRQPGKPG